MPSVQSTSLTSLSPRFRKTIWAVLALILAGYYFTLCFSDIVITYTHTINFLDCVRMGNISGFYDYCLLHRHPDHQYGADYLLPVYFVFSVWNLPVWILLKLGIVTDPYSPWCILWCKGLPLLAFIGCCWMLCRILHRISFTKEQCERTIFLFSTSLLLVVPLFATAQYDVLELFFILAGIYCRMREGRLSWRVLVLFSFAATLKSFALFVFLMLVLLDEKRLLYIIRDIFVGVAGMLLSILPFLNNAGFQQSGKSFHSSMLDNLFISSITAGSTGLREIDSIPLFPAVMLVICLVAYFLHAESERDFLNKIAWLCFAMFGAFFTFVGHNPWWTVLLVPFMILLVALNEQLFRINSLLCTAAEVGLLAVQVKSATWQYLCQGNYLWPALAEFDHPLLGEHIVTFSEVLTKLGLDGYMSAFYALFAVCVGALLYLCRPWPHSVPVDPVPAKDPAAFQKWLYIFRVLFVAAYLFIALAISLIV